MRILTNSEVLKLMTMIYAGSTRIISGINLYLTLWAYNNTSGTKFR